MSWYSKYKNDEDEDILGDVTKEVLFANMIDLRWKRVEEAIEDIVTRVAQITGTDGKVARCKEVESLVKGKVLSEEVLDDVEGEIDYNTLWWASKMVNTCCLAAWAGKTVTALVNDLRGFRYRAMLMLRSEGYVHDKETYKFAWLMMLSLQDQMGSKRFKELDASGLYHYVKSQFDKTGGQKV